MNGKFKGLEQYLLPNEDVRLVCQTRNGFLVLSSRRFVMINEKGPRGSYIERAIPYNCILSIESKKSDRFELSGRILDQNGKDTNETKSFEIRAPKGEVKSQFKKTNKNCSDVV